MVQDDKNKKAVGYGMISCEDKDADAVWHPGSGRTAARRCDHGEELKQEGIHTTPCIAPSNESGGIAGGWVGTGVIRKFQEGGGFPGHVTNWASSSTSADCGPLRRGAIKFVQRRRCRKMSAFYMAISETVYAFFYSTQVQNRI